MYDAILARLAFEPFSLPGVLSGAPLRVFPEGTYYRGDRKLTITKARLQEFAANIKAGLPRFEPVINIEHDDKTGRYGTVQDLEYFENGPQGPGLYATRYTLTDEGRKLLEQDKFIGVSGEAIWTLFDGAKYQDPQSGKYHDNVLVGMALTNKPFFGKEVNLFSDLEELQEDNYRTFTEEERRTMAKSGAAMPGGRYPIANAGDLQNAIHAIGRGKGSHAAIKAHIKKRAAALGLTDKLPEDWKAADPNDKDADDMADQEPEDEPDGDEAMPMDKKKKMMMPMKHAADAAEGAEHMADEKPKTTAPEQFTLSADQYKALQDKAAEVDRMSAMLGDIKRARRIDQLTAHAETFTSVPVGAGELAEKFAALEEKDADLFKFFDGLIATMDAQVSTGGLFSQMGSGRGSDKVESFVDLTDQIHKEKFGGKPENYVDAMREARKQRPDLAAKYETTYTVRPPKTAVKE